jgi:hypothetical protein
LERKGLAIAIKVAFIVAIFSLSSIVKILNNVEMYKKRTEKLPMLIGNVLLAT